MPGKILGLGAGGHARVLIDILQQQTDAYEIVGLVDSNPETWGKIVLGIPVLSDERYLDQNGPEHFALFMGLGLASDLRKRATIFNAQAARGFHFISVLHPRSIVSASAEIGEGVAIMAGAVVNPGAKIGTNAVINTGAVIEHDCSIGSHAQVASGAVLAGGVQVGDETLIGAGAVVRPGVKVGSQAVVGAGAVVIRNVPDGTIVVGNPARPLVPRS